MNNRYTLARRILDRFERDEKALNDRAGAAQPDGYPRGGDGPRSNDISDPTAGAVVAREHGANDKALDALNALDTAVGHLLKAEKKREAALPPVKPAQVKDDWCTNCITIGMHAPRNTNPKDFGATNTRCTHCAGFRREHGFDEPDWMLEKRQRGLRITTADVAKAILENRHAKRKKKRR